MPFSPAPRREDLERRYVELAETARAWVNGHVLASARRAPSDEVADLIRSFESAEAQARNGDLAPAVKSLESFVPSLLARADAAAIDGERPRARAQVERTISSATLAETYRLHDKTARRDQMRPALEAFSQGERSLGRGDFERAVADFRNVTALLQAVLRDATLAALEERMREVRRSRSRLVDEIRRLPEHGFTERQRDSALASIRRLDAALESSDEVRSKDALAECEAILRDEPPAKIATPRRSASAGPRARSSFGMIGGLLVGLTSIAAGLGLVTFPVGETLDPRPDEEVAALSAAQDEPPPKASARSSANAGGAVARSEPAAVVGTRLSGVRAAKPPAREPLATVPPAVKALANAQLGRIREASSLHSGRRKAEEVLGLRLLRVEPPEVSLTAPPGRALRFTARVGDGERRWLLRWELDGLPVGRGERLDLPPNRLGGGGIHWLALAAVSGERRQLLRAWQIDVRGALPAGRTDRAAESATTEILVWIDAYCRAFERGDVATLVSLGEIAEGAAADALRAELAARKDLSVSCTNPAIVVEKDRARLTFDRVAEWTGAAAVREEGRSRIDRWLRLRDGVWRGVDPTADRIASQKGSRP